MLSWLAKPFSTSIVRATSMCLARAAPSRGIVPLHDSPKVWMLCTSATTTRSAVSLCTRTRAARPNVPLHPLSSSTAGFASDGFEGPSASSERRAHESNSYPQAAITRSRNTPMFLYATTASDIDCNEATRAARRSAVFAACSNGTT